MSSLSNLPTFSLANSFILYTQEANYMPDAKIAVIISKRLETGLQDARI